MIKIGSSDAPERSQDAERQGRFRWRFGRVTAVTAVAAMMLLVTPAAASAVAQTETSEDGTDVSNTIIGSIIVLALLIALFLVIRRLRRKG